VVVERCPDGELLDLVEEAGRRRQAPAVGSQELANEAPTVCA
jgi:hypothetical protein